VAKRAATQERLPSRVDLQLARLVPAAPEGREWLHEVKFDGYRVLLWRSAERVRISSRGDQDWSAKLPATASATRALDCHSCILDGELITIDAAGVSSFGKLQQRFGASAGETQLQVMVFDLLWLNGEDWRERSQLARKEGLARLLRAAPRPLRLTRYAVGRGPLAARAACQQGLEGIVCKSAAAAYAGGRGGAWLKVKCVQADEYAIVGYTRGQGAREALGSLLLGSPGAGSRWRYCGRVGTGFTQAAIPDLLRRLQGARQARGVSLLNPPTRAQLRGATPVWVRPQLVVEVQFRGLTEEGLLRQASLRGLRPDRTVGSLTGAAHDAVKLRRPAQAGAKHGRARRRRGAVAAPRPGAA